MPNFANQFSAYQTLTSLTKANFRAPGMRENLSIKFHILIHWTQQKILAFRKQIAEVPPSVIVSSLIINVLGLALPVVILQIYDRVLVNKSIGTLFWLLMGLATVVIVEASLKIMRSHLMFWTATQSAYQADALAVSKVLNTPANRIKEDSAGTWMDRFDFLDQVNGFKASPGRLALLDVPFILIYLMAIYFVAGPLTLAIIAVVSMVAIYAYFQARALRDILHERSALDRRRFNFLEETFQHISTATSSAMEPQLERRFEQLQRLVAMTIFRKNLFANELTAATSLITNIVLVVVVTVGAFMAINNALSVGALACATMLTSRLIQPIVRSIPVFLDIETTLLAEQQAKVLSSLPADAVSGQENQKIQSGHIRIMDVTYTYADKDTPAINIPDLTIPHGQIIGIKGEQSNGKSTLLGLLAGELTPTTGAVYIGGEDLRGSHRAEILSGIRSVGPDPVVFKGTLLENIIMHRPGDAIEIGRRAAQLIGLEESINRLPKGFDTPLGDGSADVLPAGMLQQVSIARALSGEPQVLLFDEANSRLDMRADAALRNGLEQLRGHMTCLLVSNRPSLLAIADRIFELRQGQLLEVHPAKNQTAVGARSA